MISIILLFLIVEPFKVELTEEVKVPVSSEEVLKIKTFGNYTYFLLKDKILREGNGIIKFGNFGMEEGELTGPVSIDIENGRVFVLDRGSKNIKVFDRNGNFLFSREIETEEPTSIAISGEKVFILDPLKSQIDVYGESSLSYSFGHFGKGEGFINSPLDIDVIGGRVYVLERDRVSIFSEIGDFIQAVNLKNGKSISVDKYISILTDSTTILFDQSFKKIGCFKGEFSATEGKRLVIFENGILRKYNIGYSYEGK
ncbi:MAG: hypothetical protein ABIN61_09110 [candidate division WOR-3 bacterium]